MWCRGVRYNPVHLVVYNEPFFLGGVLSSDFSFLHSSLTSHILLKGKFQSSTMSWTRGEGGWWRLVLLMLGVDTRWRWLISLTPSPLYPGEKVGQCHLIAACTPQPIRKLSRRKNFHSCWESNSDSPVVKLTTKFHVVVASLSHSKWLRWYQNLTPVHGRVKTNVEFHVVGLVKEKSANWSNRR